MVGRIGDLISQHADDPAELESPDNTEAARVACVADVAGGRHLQHMAGCAPRSRQDHSAPVYTPGVQYHSYTRPELIGVVGDHSLKFR